MRLSLIQPCLNILFIRRASSGEMLSLRMMYSRVRRLRETGNFFRAGPPPPRWDTFFLPDVRARA
jgi:hypothetical protein